MKLQRGILIDWVAGQGNGGYEISYCQMQHGAMFALRLTGLLDS